MDGGTPTGFKPLCLYDEAPSDKGLSTCRITSNEDVNTG